jgi:hypothetical protein
VVPESVRSVRAVATRDGKWWLVELPELGAFTQARKVSEIEVMAHDLAAIWLDVDPSTVAIEAVISSPAPEPVPGAETYRVDLTRDGRLYRLSVPALNGSTRARREREIELTAREYIAALTDVRLESVGVEVHFEQQKPGAPSGRRRCGRS